MAYRSRNQNRDQQIERRIDDSWRGYKRRSVASRVDSPELLEVRRQNPDMTWNDAIDMVIRAELAERAGAASDE